MEDVSSLDIAIIDKPESEYQYCKCSGQCFSCVMKPAKDCVNSREEGTAVLGIITGILCCPVATTISAFGLFPDVARYANRKYQECRYSKEKEEVDQLLQFGRSEI